MISFDPDLTPKVLETSEAIRLLGVIHKMRITPDTVDLSDLPLAAFFLQGNHMREDPILFQ